MRVSLSPLASAALALALGSAVPAVAQSGNDNMPSVEIELTSVALGIGGQSGDGVLTLPNLGTNRVYPFEIEGFGGGLRPTHEDGCYTVCFRHYPVASLDLREAT